MEKNIIGRQMRIYRAMQNPPMQQVDLLAKIQLNGLEISQSTLSKIENGDRTVSDSELLIIAKSMNVEVLWLLGQTEVKI